MIQDRFCPLLLGIPDPDRQGNDVTQYMICVKYFFYLISYTIPYLYDFPLVYCTTTFNFE